MATKTTPKKKAAAKKKAPAKKAAAKKSGVRLTDVILLSDNEKVKELMNDPKFKAEFEKRRQAIIDGYNRIQSPPYACKPIVDKKSGLIVLLQAQPSNPNNIQRGPCAVTITTMVGRIQYTEQNEFPNLRRACEYIKDYDQLQSSRFTEAAIRNHARDVVNAVTRDLIPMIDKAVNGEAKQEVNSRSSVDQRREEKK